MHVEKRVLGRTLTGPPKVSSFRRVLVGKKRPALDMQSLWFFISRARFFVCLYEMRRFLVKKKIHPIDMCYFYVLLLQENTILYLH